MTWLEDLPSGSNDWERVAALFPDYFEAVVNNQHTLWTLVDPVALELCRLRMAQFLHASGDQALRSSAAAAAGLTEDKIAALPSWPTSELFSEKERACLAFAEQFVLDVQGVRDQDVAELQRHLSADETFTFVHALWSIEAVQRMCLTLGITPVPATIGDI